MSGKLVFSVDIACYPCCHALMIVSFADQGTEDFFNGKNSSSARKKCPKQIWIVASRKLDQLDSAVDLVDLGTEKVSTVSGLTIHTEYALVGLNLVP